ncbi:MAG: protein kinase [Anaerolineales bacterium]|nr:protein kinase [Chloroflexota bacterium]MBL6981422.1 protein kinase [Anaerolineales bacterium]
MVIEKGDILLGKYRVERLIGRGAFAEVYLAMHLELNSLRALKILRRDQPGLGEILFDEYQQRFRLEAQLGAQIDHHNVIRVYDFDRQGGMLVLVMEFAPGGSLQDRLKNTDQFSPAEALSVSLDVAQGLAELHGLGAVHRDLKPSNILFDARGRAKVADLGLAQVSGGPSLRSQLSQPEKHPGTPGYMSPEQERTGDYLRPSSDVYSLGVILFEMLTGQMYVSQRPGTSPLALRADLPEKVEGVVRKLLSQSPERRPWSGAEAADLLRAAMGHSERQAMPAQARLPSRKESKRSRNWLLIFLGGLLSLGVIFGIGFGLMSLWRQGEQNAQRMSGEFNIAVAEFAVAGDAIDADTGLITSQQIFERVGTNIGTIGEQVDILFEVSGPEQVGLIDGDSKEGRAARASEVANSIGADLIIYGGISDDGVQQSIEPEIYITERSFLLIPEFLGRHTLGAAITIPSGSTDLATRIESNRDIAGRVQALSYMATGLSMFNLGDYKAALDYLVLALQSEGWTGETGKESLYLMIGNTYLKLESMDEGERYFSLALAANPEYSRAFIGLGEAYFVRALGIPPVDNLVDISQSDLNTAESQYLAALQAADQPESADIDVKASFGLGRLALIRSQIYDDITLLNTAKNNFQIVVTENDNPRVADLAAQAHGHLGTIALLLSDLETAQLEYQIAAETTQAPRAKAAFWAQLGEIYERMGEIDLAIDAFQKAVDIATDEDSLAKYQEKLNNLMGNES